MQIDNGIYYDKGLTEEEIFFVAYDCKFCCRPWTWNRRWNNSMFVRFTQIPSARQVSLHKKIRFYFMITEYTASSTYHHLETQPHLDRCFPTTLLYRILFQSVSQEIQVVQRIIVVNNELLYMINFTVVVKAKRELKQWRRRPPELRLENVDCVFYLRVLQLSRSFPCAAYWPQNLRKLNM